MNRSMKAPMAAVLLTACAITVSAQSRPNIVLMMADDLGYECLSANGGAPYRTPVLDELAAQGLRFTNCVAQPLCTPSRAKIMTGRYNFRNYKTFGLLDPREKTFGHVLRKAGYATCIVGKWQLGRDRKLIDHFGFDEYCLWWLENKGPRFGNVGELIQNGEVLPGKKGEYGPDVVSNFMLDFISRHKKEPFFCYYPMILTHSPFVATPDSGEGQKSNEEYFADMVSYTDKIVGRIRDHLVDLGIAENTLLLFTGDNGTGRGIKNGAVDGQPWPGGKASNANETGSRVPLVAYWPAGGVRGKVFDDPIDFSDFLPSLAELAGTSLPEDITIDGHSFAGRLRGDADHKPRDWAYLCYYGKKRGQASHFVRDTRYKLYEGERFFDFLADPLHKNPIDPTQAGQEARDAFEALGKALASMRREIATEDERFDAKTSFGAKDRQAGDEQGAKTRQKKRKKK
ncbi:MAG TPA: sulfatase-like hydrolase/transferase [Roseibacillus sp.]|nr:sulfatase-like hydrolase/transferase [Roseibacillus sp.]